MQNINIDTYEQNDPENMCRTVCLLMLPFSSHLWTDLALDPFSMTFLLMFYAQFFLDSFVDTFYSLSPPG